jgi:hypothetical protein
LHAADIFKRLLSSSKELLASRKEKKYKWQRVIRQGEWKRSIVLFQQFVPSIGSVLNLLNKVI